MSARKPFPAIAAATATAHGFLAAAEIGLKEHDWLSLAHAMMAPELEGRRASPKLPGLAEVMMAKPWPRPAGQDAGRLAAGGAADRIGAGAPKITGRERFRKWGTI